MAPKRERRARGSGTIQRQRDGSWIARTTDKSRSGRFPRGSAGYREAEEALERWNRSIGAGRNPNDSRQKVREFAMTWLNEVVKPDKQPRTLEFYKRHAAYAMPYIGEMPLEVPDEQVIERTLGKLAAAGLAPRSVEHVRSVLHNMFGVAKRWHLRADNPVTAVPHRNIPEQAEKAIAAAQVAVLLEAVKGDRLEALWYLALTLGLRRGELLGLRWSDIDWDAGIIRVTQQVGEDEYRKTVIAPFVKSKESRPLPMTADVKAQLERRRALDAAEAKITQQRAAEKAKRAEKPIPIVRWNVNDLVFPSEAGTVILPANLNRRLKMLVARINRVSPITLPANLSPHTLRHTALTDLAAHGEAKAVQSIAGHANIDTTMRIYAGRRMGAMRDAVEKMERGRKAG